MKQDYSNYVHDFRVNDRVRFASESPENEPVGTVIETGYCSIKIGWDDDHAPTLVTSDRLRNVERV